MAMLVHAVHHCATLRFYPALCHEVQLRVQVYSLHLRVVVIISGEAEVPMKDKKQQAVKCTITPEDVFNSLYLTPPSTGKPLMRSSNMSLLHCTLIVSLFCKSTRIKASAKWLNLNVTDSSVKNRRLRPLLPVLSRCRVRWEQDVLNNTRVTLSVRVP